MTPAVGRGAWAARGQNDQTPLLQLEHQSASGHILALAGIVLPVPLLAEDLGELAAAGRGMRRDEPSQWRQMIRAQRPPLNHQPSNHVQSMTSARSGVQQHRLPNPLNGCTVTVTDPAHPAGFTVLEPSCLGWQKMVKSSDAETSWKRL